jgi:hypothetical protein
MRDDLKVEKDELISKAKDDLILKDDVVVKD